MRIPVVQLRVLMMLVNLGLAGLLVWTFYREASGSSVADRTIVSLVNLNELAASPDTMIPKVNELDLMTAAATRLQPPPPLPPEPVTVATTEEPPPVETGAGTSEEPLDTGPLSDGWEYFWAIIDEANPTNSLVGLRRKTDDPKTGVAGRTTSRVIRSSSRVRPAPRSRVTSSRLRGQGGSDTIFFAVRDRKYEDKDEELEFYIHSVDAEKFVYWVPEGGSRNSPPTFYKLDRVHSTQYAERKHKEHVARLEPLKTGEAEGEETEEKEKHWEKVSFDFEDLVEKNYQQLLRGASTSDVQIRGVKTRKRSTTGASPVQPSAAATVRARPVPSPAAATPTESAAATDGDPAAATPTADTPAAATPPAEVDTPPEQPQVTPEQAQELQQALNDAMNTEGLSPEDRQAIQQIQELVPQPEG